VASRFDGQLRWLHKVRLYPTCAQERALVTMLRVTRELYNALLQQRRDVWASRRLSLTSREQYVQLTELRETDPRFAGVYRKCEDAVLHRLDLAFAAFFRRLKRAKAGLNRALLDAGFGILASLIREKAAYAARTVIEVDARYSSQTCAACGHLCKDSRDGRRFACVRCGHADDADVNAAQVILLRAESPPMRAPGTARGGQHDAA
jgi:transposase